MKLVLGIDTGGTYTDSAVIDYDQGRVIAKAKALTTRYDLSVGIVNSINSLEGVDLSQVRLVSISTTLATNAVVEGKGGRVCLLLIGYDPDLLKRYGLEKELPVTDYHLIQGGHNWRGEEMESLDLEEAKRVIRETKDQIDAFAVSGYFSVRNPQHELQLKALIEELTDLPVVCGHHLASDLNSIRRATTAALNARLIPVIQELMASVKGALREKGIQAPLMVVRGDGSLMKEEVADQRPIETVLSGPAASVVGARFLSGEEDGIIVDMGGTTTDIALLSGGRPGISSEGATVGGWRTHTKAIDIRTTGLGGDSHITADHGVTINPQRVIPLCLAAYEHPSLLEDLKRIRELSSLFYRAQVSEFLIAMKRSCNVHLSAKERKILEVLENGPCSVMELSDKLGLPHPTFLGMERLEAQGFLCRAGLTPTDVLHAEGTFVRWNQEAACIGLDILSQQLGLDAPTLISKVKENLMNKMALEILTILVSHAIGDCEVPGCRICAFLIDKSLGKGSDSNFECRIEVKKPIVAIGAPVEAYLPGVGKKLRTQVIIPPHAEVANAIGAVMGSVIKTIEIFIYPLYHRLAGIKGYILYSPRGKKNFRELQRAVDYGLEVGRELAIREAQEAGAEDPEVKIEREDLGQEVYLGTTLKITALGRPQVRD